MICTPIQYMCGAGLLLGFTPYIPWVSEKSSEGRSPEDFLFEDTRKYSGNKGGRLFESKDIENSEYKSCISSQQPMMALQILYTIINARYPSYSFYLSSETPEAFELMNLLGIKYIKDFVNSNSGRRCYVYNVDQSELHDKLLSYCKEKYNSGLYSKFKGGFIQEAILYILSDSTYSTINPDEEEEEYDDDDYDYDD